MLWEFQLRLGNVRPAAAQQIARIAHVQALAQVVVVKFVAVNACAAVREFERV